MNPITNVKNIAKLNEIELTKGTKKSWHDIYKDSAWIFIGGLAYGLTEGDILAVFSQFGEIVNINLIRDKKTGKIKGFCFLCYANQKSTILAVDNFNGIKLCNRTIRVDHVANYKPPREGKKDDDITKALKSEGCAPKSIQTQSNNSVTSMKHKKKKEKKMKKEKKKHKKEKRKRPPAENEIERETSIPNKVKQEEHDPGYDKYDVSSESRNSERRESQRSSFDKYLVEGSHFNKTDKSDVDGHHHRYKNSTRENISNRIRSSKELLKDKTTINKGRHRSNSKERYKAKSNQYKEYYKSGYKMLKHKQSTLSCSSDSCSSCSSGDSVRYENETNKSKRKHSHNDSKDKSSSNEQKYKMSKNEKCTFYDEKSYFHESMKGKCDSRRENFDEYRSSKPKFSAKQDSYSEHKSRNRYQAEERSHNYSSNHRSTTEYGKRY